MMASAAKLSLLLCLVAINLSVLNVASTEAQIFDRLFSRRAESSRQSENEIPSEPGVRHEGRGTSVNIPSIYDMFKSGSSLGINVLSGMVKIERGAEAERSGLVSNNGRRPLSVQVFGIPVFERGHRIFNSRPSASDEPSVVLDEEPKAEFVELARPEPLRTVPARQPELYEHSGSPEK